MHGSHRGEAVTRHGPPSHPGPRTARQARHAPLDLCRRCVNLGYVARRPGAEQGIRARGIQLKADNREEHQQRGASDAKARTIPHRRQLRPSLC